MTACNNAKTDEAKKDSVATAVDTSAKKVDTAAVKVDSTKKDSTKK